MFTELFAFDDNNIIQLRKVTLWKNLFPFCSENKNHTTSDRTTMSDMYVQHSGLRSSEKSTPLHLPIGQLGIRNICREELYTLLTYIPISHN